MSSLKIPDNGVMLKGSASADAGSLPHQAFAISLSDNVIENMIKCVQTGGDISLALGENPVSEWCLAYLLPELRSPSLEPHLTSGFRLSPVPKPAP